MRMGPARCSVSKSTCSQTGGDPSSVSGSGMKVGEGNSGQLSSDLHMGMCCSLIMMQSSILDTGKVPPGCSCGDLWIAE